jgi:hypothetical protein
MQFGYSVPAGVDQAVQLVRIALEVLPGCGAISYDGINAYTTCSNAATLEALSVDPALAALVPYFRRVFGVDAGDMKPKIYYYGDGRGVCMAPTMTVTKQEGLGQGMGSSTGNYTATAGKALEEVRELYKNDGVLTGFVDDLNAVIDELLMLASFDKTRKALQAAGGELNLPKTVVLLVTLRPDDHERRAARPALVRGLLERGVPPENIITDATPSTLRGMKMLGASQGHEDFAAALLQRKAAKLNGENEIFRRMGKSYPQEATVIASVALSKVLGHAARQTGPTSGVLATLGTADKQMLAVLASCLGEQPPLASSEGTLPALSDFATVLAGLPPSFGGLGMMPLKPLAQAGVLHLATLNISLPRLLLQLQGRDMGAAAHAIAREILAVDTSTLPWARHARDAHARAVAALGSALPPAECELLARLLPKAKGVGEAMDVPSLLQLVTTVRPGLQHLLSHGVWHRRFAQLLRDCGPDSFRSFMLRSGCGQGATAWVRPLVPDFLDEL